MRQHWVIMTAIFCCCKVYFSRKWEQILGLFNFLLKMPKSHRFYSWTQVVTYIVRWEAEGIICLWLSYLQVRLKIAYSVIMYTWRKRYRYTWISWWNSWELSACDLLNSLGRKYILWSFPIFCLDVSAVHCDCFFHLAIDSFSKAAYSFCILIALAALCLWSCTLAWHSAVSDF